MKRELLKIYFFSLSFVLALFSCAGYEIEVPQKQVGQDQLLLTYSIDDAMPITYALDTEDECKLQDVYTLFFTPGGDYVAHSRTLVGKNTQAGLATIIVPSNIEIAKAWDILCIANLDDYANKGASTVEYWLNHELKYKMVDAAKAILSAIASDQAGIKHPLPMAGEANKPAGVNKIEMKFKRRVARIDLSMDPSVTPSTFVLESAQIWNARSRTDFFSSTASFAGNLPDEYVHYTGNVAMATDNAITAQLYAFPNRVMVPIANDKQTTCLIIGGKYNGSTTTSYYRINISKPREGSGPLQPHHLKANSAYKINIKSVEGEGAATLEEAYDNTLAHISYRILEWDQPGLMMSDNDEYGNRLSVSQADLLFPFYRGAEYILDVNTELSATNPISASLLPTISGEDADKFEVEEIVSSSSLKQLRIKTKTDNTIEDNYKAVLIVSWGDLQVPVLLQQETNVAPSDIEALPSPRFLAAKGAGLNDPAAGEVIVDLKKIAPSFTISDLSFEIMNPADASWLSVGNPVYDTENAKVSYTFIAQPLAPGKDVRSARVRFTLSGSGRGTAGVDVLQSKYYGQENSGLKRNISVNMFNLPYDDRPWESPNALTDMYSKIADFTTVPFVDYGVLPAAYAKIFGMDLEKTTEFCLHFGVNNRWDNYYELKIESDLPWEIIPDAKAADQLAFSGSLMPQGEAKLTRGGSSPATEEKIYITATQDLSAHKQKYDRNFPWRGSFKIQFADGKAYEYQVFQEGCFRELRDIKEENLRGMYYYGIVYLLDHFYLDRYLGARSNKWFDKSIPAGDMQAYEITPDTLTVKYPNGGGIFNPGSTMWTYGALKTREYCPRGFEVLPVDEAARFAKAIRLNTEPGPYQGALYIPSTDNVPDPYYLSVKQDIPMLALASTTPGNRLFNHGLIFYKDKMSYYLLPGPWLRSSLEGQSHMSDKGYPKVEEKDYVALCSRKLGE